MKLIARRNVRISCNNEVIQIKKGQRIPTKSLPISEEDIKSLSNSSAFRIEKEKENK